MDALLKDVRYAVRSLRQSPGFALAAIATLAVGIAAVTSLFTVVDGVLLKPLRYPDADRIVAVVNHYPDRRAPNLTGGDEIDISAEHQVFDAFAYYFGGEIGIQLGDHAEFVGTRFVHPEFFRVFGVAPIVGRLFTDADAQQSVIVGAGFAERNFGGAAAAIGRPVFIENRSYLIAGVMPAAMQFPPGTEVWAAAPLQPENRNRTGHNYRAVAKLASGVSVDAANAQLAALSQRLADAFPISNANKTFVSVPLRDTLVGPVRTTLYMLMGAVGLVLLIACANVANLMLARGSARIREVAVRAALGAGRTRIARQLLAESLVLAVLASAAGLLLADAATAALLRTGSSYVPLPRLSDVTMDARVLWFSVALAVLTTMAFGLAPAIHAARVNLKDALNQGAGRGVVARGSSAMRSGLVIAQIALSFALAINAGLLVRSFAALDEAPLGFRRDGVLVMYAHAPARGSLFDGSGLSAYLQAGRFFDDLLARLRRVPGVVAAGAAMGLPTGQYDSNGAYAVEGKQTFGGDFRQLPSAGFRLASPGYFETMQIPIVAGRDFTDGDVFERPLVTIISQSLARQSFGAENPIGHRIMCGFDAPDKWMTIVGVVGDVRQASPASRPGPELYMPLRQHPYSANEVQVVMRTHAPPDALIESARQTVRSMNPDVATKFITLEASVNGSIAAPRFRALLVATFACVALLLALAGIYAVMTYTTAQRTAEFGIRMALGARALDVVRLVLGGAGRLAAAGAALGLIAALAMSRVVASLLYGVSAHDVTTYGGVLLMALPLVAAAAAIPAIRAARTDPLQSLRRE